MYTRKHFNFVRTALMLFFALFVSSNAWADAPLPSFSGGDGSEATPYLISNLKDWDDLADAVAAGNSCTGLTFLMTTDIGTVTKPLGKQTGSESTTRNRFAGTFDGGGHTLTVGLNSNNDWFHYKHDYCAPFAYIQNVTIKNLHVKGNIESADKWASGLIGNGDGTCTIINCQISATITSKFTSTGGVRDGGFVGLTEDNSTITISDSWFDGEFAVAENCHINEIGGFIGQNKGTATFTNCLFKPSNIADNTGSKQFAYNVSPGKISNSSNYYYVTALSEDAQGGTKVDYAFYDNAVNTLTNANNKKVILWGRTLKKDGYWNTLCLPFSMTNQQVTDQLNPTALMELDNSDQDGTNLANNGTLTLKFKDATSIEAGKPYIVKWDSGDDLVNPVFTGVNINNAAPTPVVSNDGKVTFVGQYSPFEIVTSGASGDNQGNKDDIIIVSGNNKVGYSQNPRTLRCFRAHFKVPANSIYSAPVMNIVFNTEGSETTGINTVNGSEFKVNDEYYNLAGQRVAQPAKGLYIVNGRKVVIK